MSDRSFTFVSQELQSIAMETKKNPREHIEEIRRVKFSIGGKPNPVMEDLHQAVKNLSAELYAKDVHFLMELIQNAEDNEYPPDMKPSLEFIISSKDITATGATSTLLIFNNEKGFSNKNIDSICSVGRSTKKGNRQRGYIGEKGIGFKSVFLITSQPYIFSNGYRIRFSEEPLLDGSVGYIVPEWVEENPTLSDIHQIYGSDKNLPTTTIVLPLKSEKVQAVKQQLSSIHPEVLLFLSKIKQLSIREDNEDPKLNTVNAISISSETEFRRKKNIDAESYVLHLYAEENKIDQESECSYRMWRQKFPVALESRVERRMDVEEWVITLAFPHGQRLNRGRTSPGIYAFLPTEMVTNFPFIIQADFVLASSRETILLDNKWNMGILDCVASAFVNAFVSLVKETDSTPISLPPLFEFLPVNVSSYQVLNTVRDKIRSKVVSEYIIPCESYTQQKIFSKPDEVGRLLPAFWNILLEAREQGVGLQNLSSHGICILSSAFDKEKYDVILDFLGVKPVGIEWYAKCIESSNLVLGVSEYVYMKLLYFFAENWISYFRNTGVKRIPLLKCIDQDGKPALWSINGVTQSCGSRICFASDPDHVSWLLDWNLEFRCVVDRYFLPKFTQECLNLFPKKAAIRDWLRQCANVAGVTVYDYSVLLVNDIGSDRRLAISFTHFLYHSHKRNYLSGREVSQLCDLIPLVDNYGRVTRQRRGVLVPANNSKWVGLLGGSNPWTGQNYVELAEDYLRAGHFAGLYSQEKLLSGFLATFLKALDIPDVCPADAVFRTVSSPLTKDNTFLLLDWIKNLKYKGLPLPGKFLRCIKDGSWLKTSVGYRPPSESFLSSFDWGNLLQMGSILVDIPLIDQEFYGNKISDYKEELKTAGVMFEYGEACQYIGKHLMKLASCARLTKGNVFSMLSFIRFLRGRLLPVEDFINSIKEGKWLKTKHGDRSPVGSVLFDSEWKAALGISSPPFIDNDYYGEEILSYRVELELLGVVVGFNQNYQIVENHLRLPTSFESVSAQSILLMLGCIRHSRISGQLAAKLKDKKWLRTNLGFRVPAESFLFNHEWGCLLKIFNGMPLIDEIFYGNSIRTYINELKEVGVVITLDDASKAVTRRFKENVSFLSFTRDNVFSLLDCYRHLKGAKQHFPGELRNCMLEEKWLRTRLGYRCPKESILFNAEWKSISPIVSLPFIDDVDGYYGNRIYKYSDELKHFGAAVEFKDGSRFVAVGLNIRSPSDVTPSNALSLLKCVRNILGNHDPLPKEFMGRINKKWLKTVVGFRSPGECILFDSNWGPIQREDGPFIDEVFYGAEISSYRNELNAIGVVVEVDRGCSLMAEHLICHSHVKVISRIYEYLSKYNWVPDKNDASWIWIPQGVDKGKWAGSDACVLHDKDNLFSLHLNVLDKFYETKVLSFFSKVLGVRTHPTIDDYCQLWSDWENAHRPLAFVDCCAFWDFVAKHWSPKIKGLVSDFIRKVPVSMGSGGIRLVNKDDVFIPNDLQLRDLFEKACPDIFAWYPQPSPPSLSQSKLYEIYTCFGVRTISESVEKDESFETNSSKAKKLDPRDAMIRSGLFRIVLGFLADSSLELPSEARHLIVKQLHDLEIFELDEPITVCYSLLLSSGKSLSVNASQMVRWDRENSELFIQKTERSSGYKANIEFCTYFSEAISRGLLWDKPDQIDALSELIKLGCLLEFDDDAVKFLLKTKNLLLFVEDEEFLSSTLSFG